MPGGVFLESQKYVWHKREKLDFFFFFFKTQTYVGKPDLFQMENILLLKPGNVFALYYETCQM